MSKPLVTVLLVTYNQARYIKQALDSLMVQTLSSHNFEIIVINDGSTDETAEILTGYKDKICLIEQDNHGLVDSCNKGLMLAQGSYLGRLDSDDFVTADWLRCLVDALESNPNACCVYPDRYEMDGNQQRYVETQAENLYSLQACGTLFRTDLIRKVGGFRNFYWEEYDLYLRLCKEGKFIHIRKPLYIYRRHPDSMTYSNEKRIEGWVQLVKEWGIEILRTAGFDEGLEKAIMLVDKETNING